MNCPSKPAITIAEIFEALVAKDRPYKAGMSNEFAFKVLHNMADEGKLHKELTRLFYDSKVWEVHEEQLIKSKAARRNVTWELTPLQK